MGVRVVCVGRTSGAEDLGFVGFDPDREAWVRPVPSSHASTSAHRDGDADDVLDGASCLDLVELAVNGDRPRAHDPELLHVVPGESRHLGRVDDGATSELHRRLLALPPTSAGLSAVVAVEPTFLVVDDAGVHRPWLVWDNGAAMVEVAVADPSAATLARRLPTGQHDPSVFGLPDGDLVVVVGKERRPGRLLRRVVVLGLPHPLSR